MIDRVEFKNFRVLRDAVLPLGQFTLIVGPNGSGKSTALLGLTAAKNPKLFSSSRLASVGVDAPIIVGLESDDASAVVTSNPKQGPGGIAFSGPGSDALKEAISAFRIFSLDPAELAKPVALKPDMEIAETGAGLVGALDRLRDEWPDRFDSLNVELSRWLPEYDRILFKVPGNGQRSLRLRTVDGHVIDADELSDGTLCAVAILTIAWLPDPVGIVAFEDPDRHLHPRLMQDVRDALYRLAFPDSFGDDRPPVQVIATTHSPYFLDLFRDHPEEIVIAEKVGSAATFHRLVDRDDIDRILGDASLGEAWYSGVLGGVPAER